ncbi:MAG TPA: sulfite exporter TauE/SafE family protein [Membranihabitans sp.]|nr:sulfite exporter TauE/SafE family protein [Membranihabitans sp.]
MGVEIVGYILAVVVGLSLGMVGSGGSILTVPILVYVMAVDPVTATAYSLFVVGVTSLVGALQNALNKRVDYKTAIIFGIPSILAVYVTRAFLMPLIPDVLFNLGKLTFTKSMGLMVLFAIVMILAAFSMFRPCKDCEESEEIKIRYNYPLILAEGILVGILTGLVGAGGGFLIIPALVLLAGMPMKLAVGTSLFIIAAKSLLGFIGDIQVNEVINWGLLSLFTGLSVVGIFVGNYISGNVPGDKLKRFFGVFILIMGIYILIKELLQ